MGKEYKCGECGEEFHKTSNLSRHLSDKHGSSRYECPVCNKASFKRRENLLDKHIKYAHEEVYEKLKANKDKMLKPLTRQALPLPSETKRSKRPGMNVHQNEKAKRECRVSSQERETDGQTKNPKSDDLAPLSPGTARTCDSILAGASQSLFPGENVSYSPLNMDGTKPEAEQEYHPTPLCRSPSKKPRKTKSPRKIPMDAGSAVEDPRPFHYRVKSLSRAAETKTCNHGVTLPVMEVVTEVLQEGKRETIRINCTECPIPRYLKHRFTEMANVASQAAVETREMGSEPIVQEVQETGCDPVGPETTETGCDAVSPEVEDKATSAKVISEEASTNMEPGDTPGEAWLSAQLLATGLDMSEASSSEDGDEFDSDSSEQEDS